MKKNDFATFIVYLGMFGIAVGIGLGVIRNKIATGSLPIHGAVIIVIAALISILINSILMELGHMAGAKVGKYQIASVTILGLCFRKENGKRKASFKAYDGLTGQTRIVPLDPKVSSPSSYIFFPVLFLLGEVILMVALIVIAKQNSSLLWLEIACDTVLCIAAMLTFYNLFPARLDSTTDGYLMMLVGKPVNRLAYNHMLLADDAIANGKNPEELPIYDDVTDFTARLNNLAVYRLVDKGDYGSAIKILDKTIEAEKGITESTKNEAFSMKLSLLFLSNNTSAAKEAYEAIEDNQRKYISEILSCSGLRNYMLISALLDGSFTETRYAYLKIEHLLKHTADNEAPIEKKLIDASIAIIKKVHPTWDLDKEEQAE